MNCTKDEECTFFIVQFTVEVKMTAVKNINL